MHESRPSVIRIFCDICRDWYVFGENHEHTETEEACETDPKAQCIRCQICDESYEESEKNNHFQTAKHIDSIFNTHKPMLLVETAVQCRLQTYFLRNPNPTQVDYRVVLRRQKLRMLKKLREAIRNFKTVKTNLLIYAYYVKLENDEVVERRMISFKTVNVALNTSSKVEDELKGMFESIVEESENFEMKDSGWTLEKILGSELRINRHYQGCRGGKYIKLPFPSNFVVNVKNTDDQCFRYAMLGKHLPQDVKKKQRVTEYNRVPRDIYNFNCITFPVELQDIDKFERGNPGVSVSIYGIRTREAGDMENKKKKHNSKNGGYIIYPLRITKERQEDHTDLLFIQNEVGDRHFAWITSLEKLVRSQLSNKKKTAFLCDKCLTHFFSAERLKKHQTICRLISKDGFLPVYPKEPYLYFKNHHKEIKHQCVVYADFESFLRRLDEPLVGKEEVKPSFAYQRHDPLSVAYVVASSHPQLRTNAPVLYRRNDANSVFLEDMIQLARRASWYNNDKKSKIIMTEEEKRAHQAATHCAHCAVSFEHATKTRDHSHEYVPPEKSNYRKALCKKCNFKYVHAKNVVVYFHNSSRYDLHYVVKALAGSRHRVDIIPSTEENYISLRIRVKKCDYAISFVDSFRFLPSSLDSLVAQLPDSAFVETKKFAKTVELFEKCKRKAILPYDFIESERNLELTHPPPIEAFYNRLLNCHATEEEYARFCEMWHLFGCKTLGDYIDRYLELDVCLLMDMFEENRRFFLETYGLDPANYLTLPSYGFDAFLKMSEMKIETFRDHDMTLFVLQGIYGGITQCVTRYAKANNVYIPETYDPSKPSIFIQYVDATGLYANAMCMPLPYAGYRWLTQYELDSLLWDSLRLPDDNGEDGMILEVSLDYPHRLHDLHSDLPFCPRTQVPPTEDAKTAKLLTTLEPKSRIVLHFAALKQALRNGLVLKAVHRGLAFKQAPFLRGFIELNTRLRQHAQGNKFKQSLVKLISNSCFGKFLENPLKRKNVKLATNPASILKLISRIDFLDRTIFDEELVAVHLRRTQVKFDRPMIVGLSILALSKVIMYNYFYDHILPKYGRDNVKLLYMDTDSYIMSIATADRYRDLVPDLHMYDTSNYPPEHFLFSSANHKKMGTFTDETGGLPISEFVGLGSKVYAVKTSDNKVDVKAKGVQRCETKKFSFDIYMQVLRENVPHFADTRSIVSKKHVIYTQQTHKRALTGLDDKRVILEDGINTLPYGHKDLRTTEGGEAELPTSLSHKRAHEDEETPSGRSIYKRLCHSTKRLPSLPALVPIAMLKR